MISIILVIFVSAIAATQTNNEPKLSNGHLVDSLKRFPHHVTIERVNVHLNEDDKAGNLICGGSILNEQWILTSAFCIDGSDRLELHFEQLYYNNYNSGDSFSIVVNKDEIYMHPTFYYDIALIRLPIVLVFSDNLKPISISSSPVNLLEGRLAVMPGFDVQRKPASSSTTTTTTTSGPEGTVTDGTTEWTSTETSTTSTTELLYTEIDTTTISSNSTTDSSTSTIDDSTTNETTIEWISTEDTSTTTSEWSSIAEPTISSRLRKSLSSFDHQPQKQLIYGMFKILSNDRCKASDNEFDEFLQMCTESWIPSISDDESIPCWNYGSGLIVGWPADPKLIGIYSVMLNSCNSTEPAIYTNIAEYLPWIESVIYTINP